MEPFQLSGHSVTGRRQRSGGQAEITEGLRERERSDYKQRKSLLQTNRQRQNPLNKHLLCSCSVQNLILSACSEMFDKIFLVSFHMFVWSLMFVDQVCDMLQKALEERVELQLRLVCHAAVS